MKMLEARNANNTSKLALLPQECQEAGISAKALRPTNGKASILNIFSNLVWYKWESFHTEYF
ncbi:MAG: hypothetical protein IT291_05815 [Deltaproteobacteria bacterium]|nr:hypothetical protein [Deltaproteobacteria bacterium]